MPRHDERGSVCRSVLESCLTPPECPTYPAHRSRSALRVWAHFCATLGISQQFAATFVHQQLGGAERANRHIEQLLRTFCKRQDQWATCLPIVEFTHNTCPSKRLGGLSPFEAVFGWTPRRGLATELIQGAPEQQDEQATRQELQPWVTEQLLQAQDENFRRDDRPHFDPSPGDRVFLSSKNVTAHKDGLTD